MIAATNKIHNAPIVGVLRLSETKLKCLGSCFFRAPINGILILNYLQLEAPHSSPHRRQRSNRYSCSSISNS